MSYGRRGVLNGSFIPTNLKKYKGDPRKITYRSSWELYVMKWLDKNDEVEFWNSEEVVIPYFSSADNRNRRYFVDFWIKFKNGQEFLFEVKPHKETIPPERPTKMTKKAKERFLNEYYTYTVNQDKWKAAYKLSRDEKNFKFRLVTEHTLRKMGWRG